MDKKNNWKAWIYLAPALILMALFTFYPLINTFIISFLKDYNSITGACEGFTFDNYSMVLGIKPYLDVGDPELNVYITDFVNYALPNTLLITFVTVPISIILALAIAIGINSIKWLRGLFQTIFFLPYVTNVIAVGMVFALIFSPNGFFNQIFGIVGKDWVRNTDWASAMFVLCTYIIWTALPYKILIFLSGLQNIDKQYYEAARVDSASKRKTIRKITIPLLSPQILYIMITSFIGAFKEYNAVVGVFNGASTSSQNVKDLYTVVYYIYDQISSSDSTQISFAAAAAVILFAIILLLTIVQMPVSKKKVHY